MPIHHIVCFKFKPDVQPEQIDALHKGLLSLKSIEGVTSLECGKNFSGRADYDYVLSVHFPDHEALNKYAVDPLHEKVKAEVIAPIKQDLIALDYVY